MPLTLVSASMQEPTAQYTAFKNRIINGDMRIDQRNAGASVTPTDGAYTIDRWSVRQTTASKFSVQQNAAAVTPPAGFNYYFGATSLSAFSVGAADIFALRQKIEGYNMADLAWGTASAQTVTLSFWVRSSLTGTFGGSLSNDTNQFYAFTFSISSANTWEQKSITITGPTSGTWLTTTGTGITVQFSLGTGTTYSGTAGAWTSSAFYSATGATSVVGTSGATFYITGVQLEKGSTATSFDYLDYGRSLAQCQRYFYQTVISDYITGQANAATSAYFPIPLKVPMRTNPTGITVTGTIGSYLVTNSVIGTLACSSIVFNSAGLNVVTVLSGHASGTAAGNATLLLPNGGNIQINGAEL